MRFEIKDLDKIKEKEIKSHSWCKGIINAPGEYQVVIGADVIEFYNQFQPLYSGDINFEVKNNQIKQGNWFSRALRTVSRIFAPIVTVLIAYGLISTIRALGTIDFTGNNGSLAGSVEFFNQFDSILKVLIDGLTLFITVGVAYTTFKAFNCNGLFGLALGVVLTSPALTAMGAVTPDKGQNIIDVMPGWNLFNSTVFYPWKISFAGLIIPMIGVAIFGAYMEKWTNNIKNGTAKMLLQPLLVILTTYLVAIFIIAPIGLLMTNYISIAIKWATTQSVAKFIFTPILAACYGPMVILGLHRTVTPILFQDQALYQGTILIGFIIINNISQGVACLAMNYQHRKVKNVSEVAIPSGLAAIVGGISEPVLFGVNFKYLYPLLAASIGTLVGTILITAAGVFGVVGSAGIFGIISMAQQPPTEIGIQTWAGGGIVWETIGVLVMVPVTFISTIILGQTKYFKTRTAQIFEADWGIINEETRIEEIKPVKTNNKVIKKYIKEKNKYEQISKRLFMRRSGCCQPNWRRLRCWW
ncbi:PTS transporter subunit EIIC [Spiroplasma alleghenense]|uniref:PTS system, trehalose-specific IIBC component n=1 Tax=Spiroplasma alleghenense TaxID=216931 RepID=A0A345Z4S1_9MOLU|nr:PTS transporter subunit EIIC [Spiroplasma alleghenense]AXK51600.1 PTS system, trehalose-specific IIBC component [Spiroplasma alleghenense]